LLSNAVKSKLKAGQTVFGCFVRQPDAALVELLGYFGWDFLVFDGEHSTLEPRDCENLTRAAELRGLTPIARVPDSQPATILRFLDTGVQGLHVPGINSAAEAEAVIRAVKYHPCGQRGLAGVRAASYDQAGSLGDYVRQSNAETLVIVHIESAQAVECLPDILAVADVDVAFLGLTDLSHSLGLPGQLDHPRVQEMARHAADLVARSPVALGMMVNSATAARQWQEHQARYITIGLESLLGAAARGYLQAVRAGL
jgi:4-hydroxy-2-oxoheptanedioate aldolase